MDENKGLQSKLNNRLEKVKARPETGQESLQSQGLSGVQYYDQPSFLEPLIDIENNYDKYMGAPKVLMQSMEDDLREIRAQNQSFGETLLRGTGKFVAKSAIHGVGGITSPIAALVAGGWDNEWNRLLDKAVEGIDELAPIYKTQAQQDAKFLSAENLLSDNFWFDDFLGAMSFVAGSALSGYGIGAIGKAGKITQRLMKMSKKLKNSMDATETAALLAKYTKYMDLGKIGINTALSSYEAGLQAREFKDLALEEIRQQHILENFREPTEEELNVYKQDINSVANGIFAANVFLVSTENAVMLNKIFGKPLKRLVGPIAPKKIDVNYVPSRFSHILKTTFDIAKTPLIEGSQEFAQGLLNTAGLEYVLSKYSPEAHNENLNMAGSVYDAMSKAFTKTVSSEKGLDEAYIGMLMGFLGMPIKGAGGSITSVPKLFRKPQMGILAQQYHQYSGEDSANIMKNLAAHMARVYETNKEQERDIESGDFLQSKSEEAKQILSWMTSRENVGLLDDEIDDYIEQLMGMDYDTFKETFGYAPEVYTGTDIIPAGSNLAKPSDKETDLNRRKEHLKQSLLRHKNNFRKAKSFADSITLVSEDKDVNEFILFNVFMNENAKDRLNEIEKNIKDKTGIGVDEIEQYFSYKGNLNPDAPKSLRDYVDNPGNYANLIIDIKDHRRLSEMKESYNTVVKGLYDIDNQRRLMLTINYMKYGLFERFGRNVDISKSYLEEWKMFNKAKDELLEELKGYENYPELKGEVENEIDYVQQRMDALKAKMDNNFASTKMKTVKRMLQVDELLDQLIEERERYERLFDDYKKINRNFGSPQLESPYRYTKDADDDDRLDNPPGSRINSIKRNDEGRPTSYSYNIYDEEGETVEEKFVTREDLKDNNYIDKDGLHDFDEAIKVLKAIIAKSMGLKGAAVDTVDAEAFLDAEYGIDKADFISIQSIKTNIKDANGVTIAINTNRQGTVYIALSDNLFDGSSSIANRIAEMFTLRNEYNKKSKAIIDKASYAKKIDAMLEPNERIATIEVTQTPNNMKMTNSGMNVIMTANVFDTETGVVYEKQISIFVNTTDTPLRNSSATFSKAQDIKDEAMKEFEETMDEIEKIKSELNKIRKGSGVNGFKVGDKIDECN